MLCEHNDGAQPKKLAQTLRCSVSRAQEIYDSFWRTNTSLGGLKRDITEYWKEHGYLKGIDGRKVMTRSKHSLINTLFQSGGAIAMKVAMIWWDEQVKREKLNARQVIFYHDEFQVEEDEDDIRYFMFFTEEHANSWNPTDKLWSNIGLNEEGHYYRAYSRAGELGVMSIREAGKQLGLKVPLDASYSVGLSWASTH